MGNKDSNKEEIMGGIRKTLELARKIAIFRHAENFVFVQKGAHAQLPPAVRKGQFFIISAVIIASMLLIISHNFSSFSEIVLTKNIEMSELEYIGMIKKSLNDTIKSSDCGRLEDEISAAEDFLSRKLAEQGIEMAAKHQINSCNSVKLNFSLSSQNFFSSTEFPYP